MLSSDLNIIVVHLLSTEKHCPDHYATDFAFHKRNASYKKTDHLFGNISQLLFDAYQTVYIQKGVEFFY